MFILKLKYSKPVDEVDKVLASHTKYLKKILFIKKVYLHW